MRAPGFTEPGAVIEVLVSNIDIMPTLIDLLGLTQQENMDGESFKQAFAAGADSFRKRIFIHWSTRSFVTFDGEWKYQLHWKGDTDELYNLRRDPGEMINLVKAPQYRDIAEESRNAILDWLRDTDHPHAEAIN
jgi:arylsulfatase A-like enzyme